MSTKRFDRQLNTLLYIAAILVVIVLVGGGYTIVLTLSGNSNIEAIQDDSAITSCRAQYQSIVTSANNEVSSAIATAIVDAIRDPTDLAKLQLDADLILKAQNFYNAATDTYEAALRLATEDPDAFLTHCRDNPPS